MGRLIGRLIGSLGLMGRLVGIRLMGRLGLMGGFPSN